MALLERTPGLCDDAAHAPSDSRDRDSEFAQREVITRDELLARLKRTLSEADATLASLDTDTLLEAPATVLRVAVFVGEEDETGADVVQFYARENGHRSRDGEPTSGGLQPPLWRRSASGTAGAAAKRARVITPAGATAMPQAR